MKATKSLSKSSKKSRSKASRNAQATSNKGVQRSLIPASYASSVTRSGPSSFFFKNREMVKTINSATSWTVQGWIVNPARGVFPWLSNIAGSFDSYRIHKLKFDWVPRCATSVGGSVTLAFDYHCMDDLPADEEAMSMNWQAVQTNTYMPASVSLDIGKLAYKKYFTRLSGSSPSETSDVALIEIAVVNPSGTPAGPIGNLWVTYEIELMEPQKNESLDRWGGEMGFPRSKTINDLPGPYTEPYIYPIETANLWFTAFPRSDSSVGEYWHVPSWLKVLPDGYVEVPPEWEYFQTQAIMRGVVHTAATLDPTITQTYFCIYGSSAGNTHVDRLTNSSWTSRDWQPAVANYIIINTIHRKAINDTAMQISAVFSYALGVNLASVGFAFIFTRLSKTEYYDLLNSGTEPPDDPPSPLVVEIRDRQASRAPVEALKFGSPGTRGPITSRPW